jgi:hypothetical protein
VLTGPEHVHVLNPEGGFCAECGEHSDHDEGFTAVLESDGWDERMTTVEASLKRIEGALALLAAEALTNVPLPADSPGE